MDPFYTLQRLCSAFGPSSYEDEVLLTIRQLLGQGYTYLQTPHKNLVVAPKRTTKAKRTLFLQAHTDELGFRVFRYVNAGFVELTPLSHIPAMASNHKLKFAPTGTHGILLIDNQNDRKKYYADIGASSLDEAHNLVPLLSTGAYVGALEFSTSLCAGKSFDDRAGCAVIVQILQALSGNEDTQVIGVFTAREESGNWPIPELIRCCEKEDIYPDLIINLEACPGGPTPMVSNPEAYVGKGVVLAHMDRYYACDSQLCHFMTKVAEKYRIHHQHMSIRTGGGEIGRLALSFGVLGYSLTIPVRYMHAPQSAMAKIDYTAAISMIKAFIEEWKGF